jgi:hypothetical protein
VHSIYLVRFVICMTATHEGYEDFQDQIFEAEEQQLLNDQGKCPCSYCAQIKDIDYFIAMHALI